LDLLEENNNFKQNNNIGMKFFIIIFLTSFVHYNSISQVDSMPKVIVDPWYIPNEDGTGYTIDIPELEAVLNYFRELEVTKLSDTDRIKIRHYTATFAYYIYPKGNMGRDAKVNRLTNLLINHSNLHAKFPDIFIEFFYSNYKNFNKEQIKRISLGLAEPIGANFENYYHVINLYQIKKFAPEIKALLSEDIVMEIKNSFLRRSMSFKYARDFTRISVLANLDIAYQDTLLEIIKEYYDFINNPRNELSQNIKTDLKINLYEVVLKKSIKNLSNKKEIMKKTLYLLNEKYVLSPHGDQPGVDCAYRYYEYMILPFLAKNRLAMDEFFKTGGDYEAYARILFEKYRTPELMRAALIEFGILEK